MSDLEKGFYELKKLKTDDPELYKYICKRTEAEVFGASRLDLLIMDMKRHFGERIDEQEIRELYEKHRTT